MLQSLPQGFYGHTDETIGNGIRRESQVIADRMEGKPMRREDTDPAANEIKVVVEHIGGRPPSRS